MKPIHRRLLLPYTGMPGKLWRQVPPVSPSRYLPPLQVETTIIQRYLRHYPAAALAMRLPSRDSLQDPHILSGSAPITQIPFILIGYIISRTMSPYSMYWDMAL